jgi:hypothetical protein
LFQFVHFLAELVQPFLPQLMLHIGFMAAPRAAPVQLIRKMDCFHLVSQGRESGLAESVIHGDILRFVTIRAKMG